MQDVPRHGNLNRGGTIKQADDEEPVRFVDNAGNAFDVTMQDGELVVYGINATILCIEPLSISTIKITAK